MSKKRLTFELCDTREQAEKFCKDYKIKNASILPHSLPDGWNGFVIWYRG